MLPSPLAGLVLGTVMYIQQAHFTTEETDSGPKRLAITQLKSRANTVPDA